MKKLFFLTILLTSLLMGCSNQKKADIIFYNARIYTVNDSMQIAKAFAVKDGKFLDVGSNTEILKKYKSDSIIDLKEQPVYPGFIDAHCHFWGYGLGLANVNLKETKNITEVIERLKKHYETYPTEWIQGFGWDQNDWPGKKFPSKHDLDKVFSDIPVVLKRVDGHAVWANSKAIELSGIDFSEFKEGEVLYQNGEMTGIFLENAADALKEAIPEPSKEEKVSALLNAQKNCFAVGLTSVHDAGMTWDWVELIDSLQKSGELKMRIYGMLTVDSISEDKMYYGPVKTDYLDIRSIKLYADGALGSRGAKLLEPYSDMPGETGIIVNDTAFYRRICRLAYELGFQVNTHCIGDSALRLMLNIYAGVLREPNDFRWRIEHAQVYHPDDLHFFSDYNIVPSIQTTHATSDMYWAKKRLGPERIRYAYAYKDLLNQNGWMPIGTDFPIEEINPMFSFYAGVTRKDQKGWPEQGFQTENALTREECLKGMTIWAAKAAFEENEKGSIESGKFADFVVLEQDIMEIPEKELFKIKVLKTYLAGERVY